MGYTTDFEGVFQCSPPLSPAHNVLKNNRSLLEFLGLLK